MGTIIPRRRKNGSTGYLAQIVKKRDGRIVLREAQTFDRRAAASAWIDKREKELTQPGATEHQDDPPLRDVIDRSINESARIGRSKAQALRTIKTYDIADLPCSKVNSIAIIEFARDITAQQKIKPQTVAGYLSHLGAVFAIAKPAWGYPLDPQAMKDAFVVAKRLGITSKSRKRERRPTLDELNKLMKYFGSKRQDSCPMQQIVAFAIFSTRRQEEITFIRRDQFEPAHEDQPARVLVRDMKHPGEKIGNDTWCDLPPEAAAIIESVPARKDGFIFGHHAKTVSSNFTRACLLLGINTQEMPDSERLHFHDLRHDGVSRLFEMGWNIPRAASVSGHRNWQSLQRYTHLRKTGDKYENWPWLATVTKSDDQSTTTTEGGLPSE